jgi:hypothetical protein
MPFLPMTGTYLVPQAAPPPVIKILLNFLNILELSI